MCEANENRLAYLISSSISLEKHGQLRDLKSYADDIVTAMLQKINGGSFKKTKSKNQ